MNTINNKLANAWIYMGEKDPVINGKVIGYNDPASSYQALIKNNVYQSVDILFICFVTTTPTNANTIPVGDGSSYTLMVAPGVDEGGHHPNGWTNEDYMNFVIRDSRKNNSKIKISVTLAYGSGDSTDILSNIFSVSKYSDQQNADNFAANLLAWLKAKGLDGFDVDWEGPLCDSISQDQFKLLFNAIGNQFQKNYYLTLSPAEVGYNENDPAQPVIDGKTVNNNMDFVNLQLYSGFTSPDEFTGVGIETAKLAYGAKFESAVQNANSAYKGYTDGKYKVITTWRLNSGNFDYEQTNQKQLYQLVYG
jgi:hypothetical protein